MLNAELAVVAPALLLDLAVGDPVSRWHPVALFGRGVERVLRVAPTGAKGQLGFGAALVLAAALVTGVGAALVLSTTSLVSSLAGALAGAVLLKVSFAYRQLRTESLRVARALERQEFDHARVQLGALVSRDTSVLSPSLAASAAIESLAENLCDSVVAPLVYYALLGVPGALAYRAINTLDAMVGYHGAFEYLGKPAAKADDWMNWVPARLTACLLAIGALLAGAHGRGAVRTGLRDHAQTESPNSGWPMAAMAGALGVSLEKAGYYRLGAGDLDPSPQTIRRAVRISDCTVGLSAALLLLAAAR